MGGIGHWTHGPEKQCYMLRCGALGHPRSLIDNDEHVNIRYTVSHTIMFIHLYVNVVFSNNIQNISSFRFAIFPDHKMRKKRSFVQLSEWFYNSCLWRIVTYQYSFIGEHVWHTWNVETIFIFPCSISAYPTSTLKYKMWLAFLLVLMDINLT